MKGVLLLLATDVLALLSLGISSSAPEPQLGLSLALTLASLLCLLATLRVLWGSWLTLSHVFVLFFALYTLSGPYEILYGSGQIGPFSPPFAVANWLADASVGIIAFSLGIFLVRLLFPIRESNRVAVPTKPHPHFFAIVLMLMATSSELANLARVGTSALLAGKAVYQSEVSELGLTLPSSTFSLLAFGFLGLGLSKHLTRKTLALLFCFLIIASPLLTIHLLLGQRLELAMYLVTLGLARYYYHPLTRFPTRVFLIGLLIYLIFAPLYAFRWAFPLLISGEGVSLDQDSRRLFLSSLNPALNEFGAPFGNYSIFMQRGDPEPLWGKSYLMDLTVAIPGFLYPGEKPQSIVYEFRDAFFSDWASSSAIAGTAFSSLLEARWNFGDLGPLIVFLFYGLLLGMVERLRLKTHSIWFAAFYTSFSMFALTVHRSSTGGTLSAYFWVILLIAGMYVFSELLKPLWKGKAKPIAR